MLSIDRRGSAFVETAYRTPLAVVRGLGFKGEVGRARAWARLHGFLEDTPKIYTPRTAVYRILEATEQPLIGNPKHGRPLSQRDGLEVQAVVVGLARGKAIIQKCPWSFWVSRHALGRALERYKLSANLESLVLEAHDVLLCADAGVFDAIRSEVDGWFIPAGPGGFLARVQLIRYTKTDCIVFVTAGTWIHLDMVMPFQLAQAAALKWTGPGLKLGDCHLLPAPMRNESPPAEIAGESFPQLKLSADSRLHKPSIRSTLSPSPEGI